MLPLSYIHVISFYWYTTLVTSQSQAYSYDSIGNRSSLSVDGSTRTYSYYPNTKGGNLSWVRYDGSWYYEYDQAGNRIVKAKALLSDTGSSTDPEDRSQEYWNYSWDLYNRLVNVTKNGVQIVSYTYDAENFRVERVGKDGHTVYAYDRSGALCYEKNLTSGDSRSIVHLGGTIIGWTDSRGGENTRYYAATDQLGGDRSPLGCNGRPILPNP